MRRLILAPLLFGLVASGVALAGPALAASSPLDSVQVTGAAGQTPVVTVPAPVKLKTSATNVISAGSGKVAQKGATVSIDYQIVNGRDGTVLESSYGGTPASLPLDTKQALPILVKSLIGRHVGDRVLVGVAPKEGLTSSAPASSGVQKTDTLLFLVDVKDSTTPMRRAEGTAVAPVAGLPKVTLAKDGAPTIKVPAGDPPAGLVVQPLITGTGPVVQSGQTVTVHYTGVVWRNGKVFDSSWKRGAPITVPIGVGQVVAGWDSGLVGQTVGSQILLVIPPDQGYGASGQPSAGIQGTDTMVFVVDILAAA